MRSCLLTFLLTAASLYGQTRPQGADWPMFNRDLAGTRYSPLAQVNTRNVAKLTEVGPTVCTRLAKTRA